MAQSYYFNKYFKEVKILLKIMAIWPYDNGIAPKILNYIAITIARLMETLMVIEKYLYLSHF